MDATKPYKFIGFGAMDVTKPYKFIRFGAMDAPKPYKSIGFGAMDAARDRADVATNYPQNGSPPKAPTPGFLIHEFWAGRESSISGVWAAPGTPKTIQKYGGLRPPYF